MTKKRKEIDLLDDTVMRVTYPILYGSRVINPGETITVPAEIAAEWRAKEWAAYVTAEVQP
jgi:hypothetical protein